MAGTTQSPSSAHRQASPDYWSDIARQWNLLGAPLRPCEQDLQFCADAIAQAVQAQRPLRVVILGVTPELYQLALAHQANVSAVDRSQAMIDVIWPGPRAAAIRGDWSDLPFETAARDVVLCDGGAITLPYPHGLRRLAAEVKRVLAPGGRCVIRTFVQPPDHENADDVLRDLVRGHVPNTNVLKLRLGMALQQHTSDGVLLAEVWNALNHVAPDLTRLANQIGWIPEQLLAINSYRDCQNRYSFHTLDEFVEPFVEQTGGFIVESVRVPDYVLGDRCPTVIFHRNDVPVVDDLGGAVTSRPHFKL